MCVCAWRENQKQQIKHKQSETGTQTQARSYTRLQRNRTKWNKCEECMGQHTMSTHIQAVISPAEMHSENESTWEEKQQHKRTVENGAELTPIPRHTCRLVFSFFCLPFSCCYWFWFDSWPLCVTSLVFECSTFFFPFSSFAYVRSAYGMSAVLWIAQAHLIKREVNYSGWKESQECETARIRVNAMPCIGVNENSILHDFSNSFFGEFDVKMLRPVSFWYNFDTFPYVSLNIRLEKCVECSFCLFENKNNKNVFNFFSGF